MPRIKIDDREVTVADGSTILDAAEQLGIEIPTLCFLRGYEPSTTCQVCLVRERRTGRLMPACATRVEDGMELENDTDQVRRLRRTALELLLSDHVGDCLAPCFFACPAHMDIPLMLRQLSVDDEKAAIATIKADIALPAVLGRVCPKPCEKGCRRNAADNPVAVCQLKRRAADDDLASPAPYCPTPEPDSGKRVAVVGAGPAGLATSYYLRLKGHACEIFESRSEPGGRLREEPEDDLPRQILEGEIAQILRVGVALHTDHPIDSRRELDRLIESFDAVVLCCGAGAIEHAADWQVKASPRRLEVDRSTYLTTRPGVFAAGTAMRGSCLVVRSVADGKEVAHCVDEFLRGGRVHAPGRPFSSRMGRASEQEVKKMAERASWLHETPPPVAEEAAEASEQARRCLACGCLAHGRCRLERYASLYGADPNRFGTRQRSYEVIGRKGSIVFEPGKCIKCELCVQIAERAREPLGLTFVGRGFDVQLSVPFQGSLDEGLQKVAAECVAACPTGALSFADGRSTPCGEHACACGEPAESQTHHPAD